MSHRRELRQAQQDVNDSVRAVLAEARPGLAGIHSAFATFVEIPIETYEGLHRMYGALVLLQTRLDGEAAASARDTSIAAAKSLDPRSLRHVVLTTFNASEHFSEPGMTCKQVEHQLRKDHESVSSVVNYLHDHALIYDTREKRVNPSRRKASVYRITPRGKAVLDGRE
jgi:hypothetical protein